MIQQTSIVSTTSKQLSDYIVDDSSSLGYGSGHSSTYSTSRSLSKCESRLDDFYRDAEFYDLDSVETFIMPNEDRNYTSTKLRNKSKLKTNYCTLDIDEVEPSEQFNNFDKLITLSESKFSDRKNEDENIYEEIFNDSAIINLNGIRPPKLPPRNKFSSIKTSHKS